jgi:hypothetical protein
MMYYPARKALGTLCLALGAAFPTAARALDCPAPPTQSRKDWDTQVHAEVAKIGPVKGAELKSRVRSTTQDLLARLPQADKVYIEQMMFASYCSALRDDRSLAEGAKARQILDYRRELQTNLRK